ncbi:MAG TPA: hypothetical protein VJQ56_12415 [Blastocatellia bacterium]|nr:hypothetical protein [Blastocatellia bacterium]
MKRAHQISALKPLTVDAPVAVGCGVAGVLAASFTASRMQAITIQFVTALTADTQIT